MDTLFAVCAPGLEPVLERELAGLGLTGRAVPGGVELPATALARVNLWSRVASRVLLRLGQVTATAFPELVRKAKTLPWGAVVPKGARVAFRVTCRKSRLYHSDAVAERLFAALQEAVPSAVLAEAADEDAEPTVQLFVARFDHDVCTVSADTSGALLHQRGYRLAPGKAPLRETLAAAMLLAGRVRGPMLDPMCGSGTLAIEAALLALGRAPGVARRFAFERWPKHDAAALRALREEGKGLPELPVRIEASDRDPSQLAAARENAGRAGVRIEITQRDLRELPRGDSPLVTNPPYGVRVGESQELRAIWRTLHDSGRRVLALSPDERPAGLAFRKLLTTQNGGLRVHLLER